MEFRHFSSCEALAWFAPDIELALLCPLQLGNKTCSGIALLIRESL